MTEPRLLALLDQADALARRAGEVLVQMQGAELGVTRKELNDVVTAADLASERLVIDGLRALTPEAAILSEEAGFSGSEAAPRWIIDPLDGTVNYASGLPWFSVTLAYQEQGRTVLGLTHAPLVGLSARFAEGGIATVDGRPARVSATTRLSDAVVSICLTSHYSTEDANRTSDVIRRLAGLCRGVRVIVSGGLEMSLVAAGWLDAFIGLKADIVSHAAAMPLVRAAGGKVTTVDGVDSLDEDLEKVVTNGLIHEELLQAIRSP
ncbi:inositol monophosphatase [Bosea sp. SSUT16]|jgi:myo-inositol-1(or 4)-monophosphatase|uniref:Inositol monophosphatase n=1 Tax=Bosea spartocytisi TaxID=2773451 RepID=A0A927HXM1_9HYPH|nr:inositol monophosphatase [Bosea spartocytisi]MBD3844349.1 inositol monophosphatase [Bosea spartocytisi]MCT4470545.1 inositol monophosphatase [Bosea spartocytisi]